MQQLLEYEQSQERNLYSERNREFCLVEDSLGIIQGLLLIS